MDKQNQKQAGYAIARCAWYMRLVINKLFLHDSIPITVEQWSIIKTISDSGSLTQNQIAEKSLKDKTNIARMLDLLEKKGYIKRTSDPQDGRCRLVSISAAGRSVLQLALPVIDEGEQLISSILTPEEVKQLRGYLDRISSVLKEKVRI
ncbi:MAG: MarR family transcriptional regulator [Spirochaetes bacterium]|nr:MarR family transcriptional regulator [Spirochaetota bacterium]